MAKSQKPLERQLEIIRSDVKALQNGGVPGGQGAKGDKGDPGQDGVDGEDGLSAYQVALANGFQGSEAAWLVSIKGEKGDKGDPGNDGQNGLPGADSTVPGPKGDKGDPGNDGSPGNPGSDGNDGAPGSDGEDGADGLSAYQIAVANGFVGDEAAWLLSLKGAKGDTGNTGSPGADGVRTGTTVFGYAAGAGGTVTQTGNKSTAVTLNKLTGEITMVNSALAAAAIVTFTLNNNTASAGDQLVATHHSGGTAGPYLITPRVTGAGVCTITVRNTSAGSLSEAIVIKFSVIKSANT